MPIALAIIVRVEQKRPALVVQAIVRQMVAQNEGLEEPSGVRQMPFCRACIGVRLERRVGVGQRLGQRQRQRPGRGEAAC